MNTASKGMYIHPHAYLLRNFGTSGLYCGVIDWAFASYALLSRAAKITRFLWVEPPSMQLSATLLDDRKVYPSHCGI